MEKNIIEGNKLIAEFMELYREETTELNEYYIFPKGFEKYSFTDHTTEISDLKYHTSWDWLMPVVEKIELMGYGFHKDPFDLNIIEYISGNETQIIAYQNDTDDTLIQKWYYAIVEFIKWYNTTLKL